jgi:MraZ protein
MDKKGLRGNQSATVDDKGRLKVPTAFKAIIEGQYGSELYLTSLTGESLRIYPMSVWLEVEARLEAMPSMHPARRKFLDRTSYFGQLGEFDAQGRISIPWRLRDAAGMTGEVDVLGQINFLEVWNHERKAAAIDRDKLTDLDWDALSQFKV